MHLLSKRAALISAALVVPLTMWQPRAHATTYYIAPSTSGGSDANTGAIGSPFASITHAATLVAPGDTVYLRGGTYSYTAVQSIGSSHSGTAAAPINLLAFPGDAAPILDFRGETFSSNNSGARGVQLDASYWHLQGLTVQYAADNGIQVTGSNNTLERLITRQNQDTGLAIQTGGSRTPSNNLVLNCDSYGNFDFGPTAGPHGENADGFIAKFRGLGPGNTFLGDRSFNNGDDGYDFWEAENGVTVIGCQSFHNGNVSSPARVFRTAAGAAISNYAGDGNGYKLGHDSGTHLLSNDIAFGNKVNGFDVNGNALSIELPAQPIQHGVTLVNNTSFNNGGNNYQFGEAYPHVLANDVSVQGTVSIDGTVVQDDDQFSSVALANFLSTTDPITDGIFHPAGTGADRSGTTSPTYPIVPDRDASGNLQFMSFLHLASSSALIDAGLTTFTDAQGNTVLLTSTGQVLHFTGVDVTIPGFNGAMPDLGAFETSVPEPTSTIALLAAAAVLSPRRGGVKRLCTPATIRR
jgi:hypothetical protein